MSVVFTYKTPKQLKLMKNPLCYLTDQVNILYVELA